VRLALVELWEGNTDVAAELARSALDTAADADHLTTRWYAITYAAIVAAESGDLDHLAGVLDEADRLWERLPMRYLMIVGEALRGWLGAGDGLTDAIERIERSVERSRVEGETLHLTYCLLLLARAHGLAGDPSTGREAVRDALEWSDATGQHYLVAELWRTDAELAHRGGDPEAAELSLRRAVEVAESQGASGLEARARHTELFSEGG
ncbi:MAG: transcriptional regulator, partial [Actinobacteria bacterium]|nr:transcriptional regulator [Actinomycetota bacterium]NIS33297.1 transcriptional regulator [Actinomycetota bacterium]NIU21795.1 transcriptional regulator [Actinomycetota bacterium]NIU68200.1 transcriptional regulator [Actinomycetota bacterium]NIV88487.1 transcriptional regulator [Actinomycetota bacterium]